MNFAGQQVAAACLKFGAEVSPLPLSLSGAQVLWALSLNESSGGTNCGPRYEAAFDIGGELAVDGNMPQLLAAFGSAAACSYGPWQIMFCNAPQGSHPDDFEDIDKAAAYSVTFLNTQLRKFEPSTLAAIGQIWNHGSPTSAMSSGVKAYVDELIRNYSVPVVQEAA